MKYSNILMLLLFFQILGAISCYSQAKIKFETNSFSFKELDSGKVYYYKFNFTNEGNAPLIINFVRLTNKDFCKVEYSSSSISPRESSYIKITCDLKGYELDRLSNSFIVYSNCPAPRNYRIIEFSAPVKKGKDLVIDQ